MSNQLVSNPDGKLRQSNIELLRIFAILFVVTQHYCESIFKGLNEMSANRLTLILVYAIARCAVNLFILISGYYLCENQKRKPIRVLELFVMFIGLRVLFYLLRGNYSTDTFLRIFIPNNYFIVLYSVLYIISPYVNIVLHKLNKKQFKNFLIMLIFIFSVWNIGADLLEDLNNASIYGLSTVGRWGSGNGFTIVNFLLMYIIGAYIRMVGISERLNRPCVLTFGWIVCVGVLFIWRLFNIKYGSYEISSSIEYCNPLIIAESVIIFLLFNKKVFYNKSVNTLAKSTFMCYLLHAYFLPYFQLNWAISQPTLILLAHLVVTVVVLYIIAWIANVVYEFIAKKPLKLISDITEKCGITINVQID